MTVCGFSEGAQENWLITQHINTTVLPGGERLRKVTVVFEGTLNGCGGQCRQSFEVYKWETSTINTTAAANTDNYVRVDRVSPVVSDGIMSFVEHQDIELDAHEDGFFLAVVDLGTCVTLTRILVFYHVCPEETSELVSRPEAIDSQSLGGSHSVVGECVENSSTETGVHPVLVCGPMGQWQVIVHCLCDPGYQLNTTQDQCTGRLMFVFQIAVYVHVRWCSMQFPKIFQSALKEHILLKWVMDHARHVHLTAKGLGPV